MSKRVSKAAVLGSGVMGSAIAAHFANAGIPALVLDIVPPDLPEGGDRSAIARGSVKALRKVKPAPFFTAGRAAMVEVGNLEDDLEKLREVDWIVEAVREDMSIKKKVFEAVAPHVADHAILTSNTSGLSLNEMAEVLPQSLRSRFFGTHFFNPPRYMKLLETIPTKYSDPAHLEAIESFSAVRLGKGIVRAMDTPNFIANRIGCHSLFAAFKTMQEMELTIEEVDALTGPPMARPKTGTFKLCDLVGIDTLMLVGKNTYAAIEGDESRDLFQPPAAMQAMVENKLLGRKSGAGFYKLVKKPEKQMMVFDPAKQDYRPMRKPELPGLDSLKGISGAGERVKALVNLEGRTGEAAWRLLAPTLSYSAMRLGEIAEDADTLDRGLELGFNWQLGPFRVWDALGFRSTAERLKQDGYPLPAWVEQRLEVGAESLYGCSETTLNAPTVSGTVDIPADPRHLRLEPLRGAGAEVKRNDSASLIDMGDRVLGIEFHSKMNAVDNDSIAMMHAAADEADAGKWDAIVLANEGTAFCAGANLMMLVQAAMQRDWATIEGILTGFQTALDRLEQCAVPVVVAPHSMALGGGAEVVMAGNAIQAAAESYIGLVEVGAGLLPAGGGCMRLYSRNVERLTDGKDVYPALRATFEAIGMAKVSGSAEEAQELGFLRSGDAWSMNADHRAADAKDKALALAAAGYASPVAPKAIPVMGRSGAAVVEAGLVNMFEGQYISEHDRKIGREIGRILSGGDIAGPTTVSAQHLLDLEREGFLRLCGESKTHERIEALLKTGKPVRN